VHQPGGHAQAVAGFTNVLHGNARASDDRLATEDFWVDCDALEEIGIVHDA